MWAFRHSEGCAATKLLSKIWVESCFYFSSETADGLFFCLLFITRTHWSSERENGRIFCLLEAGWTEERHKLQLKTAGPLTNVLLLFLLFLLFIYLFIWPYWVKFTSGIALKHRRRRSLGPLAFRTLFFLMYLMCCHGYTCLVYCWYAHLFTV